MDQLAALKNRKIQEYPEAYFYFMTDRSELSSFVAEIDKCMQPIYRSHVAIGPNMYNEQALLRLNYLRSVAGDTPLTYTTDMNFWPLYDATYQAKYIESPRRSLYSRGSTDAIVSKVYPMTSKVLFEYIDAIPYMHYLEVIDMSAEYVYNHEPTVKVTNWKRNNTCNVMQTKESILVDRDAGDIIYRKRLILDTGYDLIKEIYPLSVSESEQK